MRAPLRASRQTKESIMRLTRLTNRLPRFTFCFVCALVAGALAIAAFAQLHTISA